MSPKTKSFNGILRVKGRHCYLVNPLAGGQSILLFLNVPTGAAFFEGCLAATHYFQRIVRKGSGDRISINGVKSCFGKRLVIQSLPEFATFPTDRAR